MPLTPRQQSVVRMLSEGRRAQAIAKALGVTEATIRKHINDAKERLDADTLAHLVGIAKDRGLI